MPQSKFNARARAAPTPKTPAALVVERFASKGFTVPDVAEMLALDKSTIYYWLRGRQADQPPRMGGAPSRGGGGIIPAKHHPALLEAAAKRGVRLTPREVVYGR